MIFLPEIEGTVPIRTSADRFLQAFRQRVAAGLLMGRPDARSKYVVHEAGPNHLEIRAVDWWTALNVGLNRFDLRPLQPGVIRYHVRYWRWAGYGLMLSGGLGLIGLVLLLGFDARGYIARHMNSMVPGLSVDQNLLIAWGMVLFWGFVWPWLLIWGHKRPLHRLVARLIAEVDAEVPAADR